MYVLLPRRRGDNLLFQYKGDYCILLLGNNILYDYFFSQSRGNYIVRVLRKNDNS